MQYRTLGRTGLRASVIGLGAGGPSRLGQRDSIRTEAESVALVLRALDAGINFIDTAEAYQTEEIVGAAVAQRDRSQIIISTKKRLRGDNISREDLRAGLHDSLRRLRSDYIDVYHLHGLKPDQYDYYLHEIVPDMQDLRAEGKIRFLGVTENWSATWSTRCLRARCGTAFGMSSWSVSTCSIRKRAKPSCNRPLKTISASLIMFAIRPRPERSGETEIDAEAAD